MSLEIWAYARAFGLSKGGRGLLFTLGALVLPVFWLFHTAFTKGSIANFVIYRTHFLTRGANTFQYLDC